MDDVTLTQPFESPRFDSISIGRGRFRSPSARRGRDVTHISASALTRDRRVRIGLGPHRHRRAHHRRPGIHVRPKAPSKKNERPISDARIRSTRRAGARASFVSMKRTAEALSRDRAPLPASVRLGYQPRSVEESFAASLTRSSRRSARPSASSILVFDGRGVMRISAAWRRFCDGSRSRTEGLFVGAERRGTPNPSFVPDWSAVSAVDAFLPLFRRRRECRSSRFHSSWSLRSTRSGGFISTRPPRRFARK